ncbi:MAG: sigma-54-dependent Fis family transcriptional regulator [Candidatus Zixiibacteriota bacterium]|nr:MAG: sigma-54-dependent Fis family transcriptional regulator [candidate division Zixibacteria bacterium]
MSNRILIVDDEPNIVLSFSSLLQDSGYPTDSAGSFDEAVRKLRAGEISLVLLDLNLPDRSGIEFLKLLKEEPSPPLVLVISGQSEISTALEAVKSGALDYLEKPVPPEKLLASVRTALMLRDANRQRSLLVDDLDTQSRLVGSSRAMKTLLRSIEKVAPSDATVLITGANGTGKELVATRIYLQSNRRDKPFIKVNCPGIPETLFESELFGHKRGAFTGAVKDYPGKFILADSGTIFLDEIGDLPIECQAKLLRVLETGEVETLGAVDRTHVNVRVICASNRELLGLVDEGKFREDLYYRVSVLVVNVPPLRHRPDDIPLLVGEFLRRFDPAGVTRLAPEAMEVLTAYDYPGNVRQLKNIVERLTILHPETTIGSSEVAIQLAQGAPSVPEAGSKALSERLRQYEKEIIRQVLVEHAGNIAAAARSLKMDRGNLSRKIRELGLKDE